MKPQEKFQHMQNSRKILSPNIVSLCVLLSFSVQMVIATGNPHDRGQSRREVMEMTENEKKLLSPYMADAKSDKAYLIKLAELVNDTSKKMRIAALKAFALLLRQSPELAKPGIAMKLKKFLRKGRKQEGHVADQAIQALHILLQTDSKVAPKVLRVAISILKGDLGKIDQALSTLFEIFEKLISLQLRYTIYILDGAEAALRDNEVDNNDALSHGANLDHSNRLRISKLLHRIANIDAVVSNKKCFRNMFELAEHIATYTLFETSVTTNGYVITYTYVFPGGSRAIEAHQARQPKQKAAIALCQKLQNIDKTRVDSFLIEDREGVESD